MDILAFAFGVLAGVIITGIIIVFAKNDGVLRIDTSNPEKDVYRLEIDNLDILPRKKIITLRVVKTHDSHF